MRILVTGGTSHTGERLVRRLLAAGHEVRFLTRRPPDHPVVAGLIAAGAEPAEGDCTRRWTLWDALKDRNVLFSCAHIRYAPVCIQACERLGVPRYLQMSSTRRFTRWPCKSSREVAAGEKAIQHSRLDWTILRPTMIFGGRRDDNVEKLVRWFRRHAWFPMFGNGQNLLQPVFVEDLLDAMTAALERPEASTRRDFTIAGPEAITYRRFLMETGRACGVDPLLIPVPLGLAIAAARLFPPLAWKGLTPEQIRRLGEDKHADISRAREALGYSPRPYHKAIALKAEGRAEV